MRFKDKMLPYLKLMGASLFCCVWFVVAGCRAEPPPPTPASLAPTIAPPAATAVTTALVVVPPTWTAVPPTAIPPTATAAPSNTPRPTATPQPTLPPTRTALPTDTPTATAVSPTDTPAPPSLPIAPPHPDDLILGPNLLPNGSFEEGDYLQNGIPELQLPNGWSLEFDEGPTGFGGEEWDVYRRPEIRVLSESFLPAHERPLFIYDGVHTVKAFKGNGAISFRLFRDVYLEPGIYVLEINLFPDLVMAWSGEQKIWADDPSSGEVRFIAPGAGGWIRPTFGRRNSFRHVFILNEAQNVRLGAAIRGNYAIANNGWFLDDWSVRQAQP